MTYAAGAGVLLAASGWAGERLCAAKNWPRRFAWLAALAGLSLTAVLIACDADAPTDVATAMRDALGTPGMTSDNRGLDGIGEDSPQDPGGDVLELRSRGLDFARMRAPDAPLPLIVLDGEVLSEAEFGSFLRSFDPRSVDRLDIIGKAEALREHGERAAGGVLHIRTTGFRDSSGNQQTISDTAVRRTRQIWGDEGMVPRFFEAASAAQLPDEFARDREKGFVAGIITALEISLLTSSPTPPPSS